MRKYLFVPGGLMVVGALMRAALTLHWDTAAIVLAVGGVLALAVGIAANWQNVRDWFRDPRGIFVLNSIFTTILLVAILGLVNAIASFRSPQIDVTAAGRNTLAAETRKGLERLGQDVAFKQFGRARDANVDELLAAFANASGRVLVSFTDVEASPQDARAFGVLRDGTVIVSAGDRWRKVEKATEAALYVAALQVTQDREPLLCFATGDGEHGLDDKGASGYASLAVSLAAAGYRTERVALQQGSVPAACEVLLVGGPSAGLSTDALGQINAYLSGGGRLVLLVDPPVDANTRAWLALRGIAAGEGMIVETNQAGRQIGAGPDSPLALAYFDHDVTRGFEVATVFPRAVPLTLTTAEIGRPQPVAGTGDRVFERIDLSLQGIEFRDGQDRRGPFLLAVSSRFPRGLKEDRSVREGRMVVFGDSDFLTNAHLAKQGNRDLALRVVAWLTDEQEARVVSLPDRQNRRTSLTERARTAMYAVNVGLLPLLPLLAGLVQFLRSRR